MVEESAKAVQASKSSSPVNTLDARDPNLNVGLHGHFPGRGVGLHDGGAICAMEQGQLVQTQVH